MLRNRFNVFSCDESESITALLFRCIISIYIIPAFFSPRNGLVYFTSLSFTYNLIIAQPFNNDFRFCELWYHHQVLSWNVKSASRRYSEIINENPWYPALAFTFLKFYFLLDGVVIKWNLMNGYVPFLGFDEIRFYMVCILILLIFIRTTLYLYPV